MRPIWTPDDARQTALDAAQHTPEPVAGAIATRIGPWHLAAMSPPRGRHHTPEPVGMRPQRAAQRTKAVLAVAVILMILVGGVLLAAQLGALPR